MHFPAAYTDGRTAARHEVTVLVAQEALHIYDQGGEPLARWPHAQVYLSEEVFRGQPVRLCHRTHDGAVLTVEEPAILDVLARMGGGAWRQKRPGRYLSGRTFSIALLAGLLLLAGIWALPRLIEPLAAYVPQVWARHLGNAVATNLAGPEGFCTGAPGLAALRELKERLLAGASSSHPFRVRVARNGTVNAFAAPGGEVVLMAGMLKHTRNPEELAGVLAHELGHGLARHPMRKLVRAYGIRLLLSGLTADTSGIDGQTGRLAQVLVLNAYNRGDELEADRRGLALLNAADIRGLPLADLLKRLQQPAAGVLPSLLSTHPAHVERIALVRRSATGSGPAMSEDQWRAVQAVCSGGRS